MKMKNYFNNSPVFQLINLGRNLEKFVNNSLQKYSLSYFQSLMLISIYIEDRSNILINEITKTFPLTKGAVSQNISILESKELIKRAVSVDKRSSYLILTEKGATLAKELIALLENHEQRFDTDFAESQLDRVKTLNVELTQPVVATPTAPLN